MHGLCSFSSLTTVRAQRRQESSFWPVLRFVIDSSFQQSLSIRESLLRDALARASEADIEAIKIAAEDLNNFVEVVFPQGYSPELMQCMCTIALYHICHSRLHVAVVGLSLTTIIRRTAEWSADAFDPSPLLLIASTLIVNNIAQSRVSF